MSRTESREDAFKMIFEMRITGVRPEAVMAYLCETADENNEMWAQKEVTRENLRYLQSVMYGVEEHLDDINGEIASKLKNGALTAFQRWTCQFCSSPCMKSSTWKIFPKRFR